MYAANRRLMISAVPVLVVAALLGYVIGHSRGDSVSAEKTRSLLAGTVLVNAPMSWQVAHAAPAITVLGVANGVVLAPGGNAGNAGLLTGELSAGEPSPLPEPFIAHLSGLPETQVVNLVEAQAYRYSQLHVSGFKGMLTIYAVPNPGGRPTAVACYAARSSAAQMQVCERIVASLTLMHHPHSYDLTPEPGYAHQLSNAIAALDRHRLPLRREIAQRNTLSTVQELAAALATAFAEADTSLSLLEPPLVANRAQDALDSSVARARDAYEGLEAALASESLSRYNAARTQVDDAEAGVDSALENLNLLGYEPSSAAS